MNQINWIKAAEERRSIRTYRPDPLSAEEKRLVEELLNEAPAGPFGQTPRLALFPSSTGFLTSGKLGTYGFIRNAPAYIGGAINQEPGSFVDFGYSLEKIILTLTAMGWGTCWLGGTFQRSQFAELLQLKQGEVIPAVTPLGRSLETTPPRDRAFKFFTGATQRKPRRELFFNYSDGDPQPNPAEEPWEGGFHSVHRAPSGVNRQPWRLLKEEDRVHFFQARGIMTAPAGENFTLEEIDLGIAMAHWETALEFQGIPGRWEACSPLETPKAPDSRWRYLLTWSRSSG